LNLSRLEDVIRAAPPAKWRAGQAFEQDTAASRSRLKTAIPRVATVSIPIVRSAALVIARIPCRRHVLDVPLRPVDEGPSNRASRIVFKGRLPSLLRKIHIPPGTDQDPSGEMDRGVALLLMSERLGRTGRPGSRPALAGGPVGRTHSALRTPSKDALLVSDLHLVVLPDPGVSWQGTARLHGGGQRLECDFLLDLEHGGRRRLIRTSRPWPCTRVFDLIVWSS